jgi:ribosomal protein S18 acetylase RimI-like enzyme
MGSSVVLRPVTPGDGDFLRRLYAATRDDVSLAPWSEAERNAFLEMQFTAQSADYGRRFPRSDHSIVTVAGCDVGRIWIDRGDEEIRLLDIALLPEHRGQGTGRVLLERLIAESVAAGTPLRHTVDKANSGARRLYERLGFAVIEDSELHLLMEWRG